MMRNEEIEITNAVIKSASITTGDRGFLDCWLSLDYDGTGQGFGGYVLYIPKSFDYHRLESCAGHHIFRIMEIAGVTEWDDIKGKTIRVKHTWTKVFAIGHIIKDDWFAPDEDYRQIRNAKE